MIRQKRKYWVLSINCDCASYMTARRADSFRFGPRCNGCHRQLGDMQFRILGEVKAKGDLDALRIWREQTNGKM